MKIVESITPAGEKAQSATPVDHPWWCSTSIECEAAKGGAHVSQAAEMPLDEDGDVTILVRMTQAPGESARIVIEQWNLDALEGWRPGDPDVGPDEEIAFPAKLGHQMIRMLSAAMWAVTGSRLGGALWLPHPRLEPVSLALADDEEDHGDEWGDEAHAGEHAGWCANGRPGHPGPCENVAGGIGWPDGVR